MSDVYKIGMIVKSEVGKFTKIVSLKNGRYGLSGWTDIDNAKKSSIAQVFVNKYGMRSMNLEIISKGDKKSKVEAPTEDEAPKDEELTEKNLMKMKAPELKALAESLGVSSEGNKSEVAKRILSR